MNACDPMCRRRRDSSLQTPSETAGTASARRACRRRRVLLHGLLLTGALVSGLGQPVEASRVTDRIVAVVNAEVITLSELQAEIADEQNRIRERYTGPAREELLQQMEYKALTRMIERKLQVQVARNKGVVVSDEDVERAAMELARQGQTVDRTDPQILKEIREQLTVLRVVDLEVHRSVMVSESELQRYYEEHLSRFMLPEEYRISQVLFRLRPGETPEELRKRAENALAELKGGADFAALASRVSDGSEAVRGGSLGIVRQGELLPAIDRAIAGLGLGDITDLIETPQGFHIIKLEEKKPPQFRPFAEVKAEINTLVFQQKSEDRYQVWLAGLKDKAYIEVKF